MAKKRKHSGPRPSRGGIPGMGGGGLGNLMAQMQKLQEEMEKTQAALQEEEFTVSVGGGAVTIVATGEPRLRSVTINPEVVNADDVEMLQDLILTAVNDVLQKAQDLQEERMGGLTGGLGLPPGLGL
ncbi:YbaB/EbfC family nucleoid-associated protein [Litorilinea aerophila]|uniref:Nucleoid-associated protein FKZ61_12465 n=1 Tax=Litorilinea aerophila TaxID=1204385 RepID=A0A540VF71_9CHLR|nr:YbaB/EbfC family nucleoid-associated protein [Litorilinea aerophila]MCC9076932.1 YbaB/EbfC family nucleoid-associated protein [Litorilinea aerophila]GIV78508.1 MAG: hypothetical protein KatS3mg050_2902 [Litorilinea sp.]